jgi:hypothetical protein
MSANLITRNGEIRGKLYYSSLSNGEMKTKAGNFQLGTDGLTVICRNIKGRNHFNFISVDQIIDFVTLRASALSEQAK